MTRALHPTTEQLLKAAPKLARASIEVEVKLYLAGEGDNSGAEITPEMRDELLAKLAAGAYVAIDVDILAFEQRAGVANRNFVRFRDGCLIALGVSGKGTPFLRDHKQWDSLSVAGRVLTSKTTKIAEGVYELRQRVRLTAAWAVELALRNLLFGVSIGWEPTGPVLCSVHDAPIGTDCWCWPGMRLAEATDSKGNKKYEYNRAGTVRAEWVYTDAALVETSMCPIGAVKRAGFEGVRAALSFAGFELDDEALASHEFDHRSGESQPALTPEPPIMNNAPAAAATLIVVLSESQGAYYAKLSAKEQELFASKTSAERDAIVAAALAADPVVHKTKAGVEIRRSHGELALAQAKQADAAEAQLAAVTAQLAAQTEANVLATLKARVATELSHLAGTEDAKVALLRVVEGISTETLRAEVLTSLRAADAAVASLAKAKGSNPGTNPGGNDPLTAFNAGVKAYALANGIKDELQALEQFLGTPEGQTLKRAYDASRPFGSHLNAQA